MINEGFALKIADTEVRVRRCYADEPEDGQIVELTVEQVRPHWFLASLYLTIEQASFIASCLAMETIIPLPARAA